jgi:hypothetical protein
MSHFLRLMPIWIVCTFFFLLTQGCLNKAIHVSNENNFENQDFLAGVKQENIQPRIEIGNEKPGKPEVKAIIPVISNKAVIPPSIKEQSNIEIASKAEKKSVKGINKIEKGNQTHRKSQIVALVLCILLGWLGVHRFYLGYTGSGILYMLTLGLFLIGWLIDLILLIIPNGLSPNGETSYRKS